MNLRSISISQSIPTLPWLMKMHAVVVTYETNASFASLVMAPPLKTQLGSRSAGKAFFCTKNQQKSCVIPVRMQLNE